MTTDAPTTGIRPVNDKNLDEVAGAACGVLILAKSDCGHCVQYAEEIEARQRAGGLEGVVVGKLLLDAPGSGRFKLKNPWIAKLPTLPYTLVFSEGTTQAHFAASKAAYLEERLTALTATV